MLNNLLLKIVWHPFQRISIFLVSGFTFHCRPYLQPFGLTSWFRCYSTFCIWLKFPYWGEILGLLGKMTPKASNERKTLAKSALPYIKLRLLSNCAWIYLYPFGLRRCARKKAVKQEGRKKSHKKCIYISRMCGATPSGLISTKLGKCVQLTDVIKRAKFHRYNLRGFGAVRFWSFHVAIGNQGRPQHSAKRYRDAGDQINRAISIAESVDVAIGSLFPTSLDLKIFYTLYVVHKLSSLLPVLSRHIGHVVGARLVLFSQPCQIL